VARVRKLAGQRRVGHAGTLDPLATGVLPVLLGRATRLMDLIQSGCKTYSAEITLGTATETDDAEGSVVSSADIPPLNDARVEAALSRFVGEIDQTPPKYSALKVNGQRAYALARGGADPELAPRPVSIHSLNLLDFAGACLRIEVTCSKGTYIRALARDIAVALGTVGHMSSLVRTRVGPFTIEDSIDLADLVVCDALLPANRALPDAPTFNATAEEARRLLNGQCVDGGGLHADHVWVYDPEGRLIGLGSADGILLRPRLAL
jgi:tRNA pseudouridine55 synthase